METTCTTNGVDCSDYVVDTKNGTMYPKVEVQYSTKLCNYNDFDIKFKPLNKNGKERSYLKFWSFLSETQNKTFHVNAGYDDRSDILEPGRCVEKSGTQKLLTTTYRHYMNAVLNAAPVSGSGYCYANAYNPINFKYDYGDAKCDVSVSKYPKNPIEKCVCYVMFSRSYTP